MASPLRRPRRCCTALALQQAASLAVLALVVDSAYFHVHEGEEKCFMETVPEHQVLTVKYRHLENPGVACMLLFKDPDKRQVFSKRVGPDDKEGGKTAYMTQQRGEHKICLQCTGSRWFQTTALKWELSVDMGDTDQANSPATRGDLSVVEKTIMATLARADALSAENEYEKTAELEFRHTSEAVNVHIIHVTVFIVVIEAVLCVWQIIHLRHFFRREKLF